jgi:hypothetical protein
MCNTKGIIVGVGSIIISSKRISKCHQNTLLKDSFAEMLMISQLFKNHLSWVASFLITGWWLEASLLTLCVYKQGL